MFWLQRVGRKQFGHLRIDIRHAPVLAVRTASNTHTRLLVAKEIWLEDARVRPFNCGTLQRVPWLVPFAFPCALPANAIFVRPIPRQCTRPNAEERLQVCCLTTCCCLGKRWQEQILLKPDHNFEWNFLI